MKNTQREVREEKSDRCLGEAERSKNAYTLRLSDAYGHSSFSCDDSSHDLCRYRHLLWPWELLHFVLMFGLTGDCGNWRSLGGFFSMTSHRFLLCAGIMINIHLSSCGFFRDIRYWWWIEVLILLWTHHPWKIYFWYFASVQNIEFIKSTLLLKYKCEMNSF